MRSMMATCDRCKEAVPIEVIAEIPNGWHSMQNPAYGRVEDARPDLDLCEDCRRGLVQYLTGTHYEVKLKPHPTPTNAAAEHGPGWEMRHG